MISIKYSAAVPSAMPPTQKMTLRKPLLAMQNPMMPSAKIHIMETSK